MALEFFLKRKRLHGQLLLFKVGVFVCVCL